MARKTPQEKKRDSYLRDRRNTYGENDKSSRKNITRNKRLEARANRHRVRQALEADLASGDPDAAGVGARELEHSGHSKHKVADTPLGEVVIDKLEHRARRGEAAPEGVAAKVDRVRRTLKRG